MTLQEKILFHQIHPAKLITDGGAGLLALYFFWQKELLLALLLALLPSLVVSILLIRFANLEKYRESSSGMYIQRYMNHPLELIRLSGYVLMALGAWYHVIWPIPFGFSAILLAWLRGVIFPGTTA